MSSIFSGLESMGLKNLGDIKIYEEPEKEVKKIMHDTDKARANYYNYHTGQKWGEPVNYHLCLDSGNISVDNIVKLILDYIELRHDK